MSAKSKQIHPGIMLKIIAAVILAIAAVVILFSIRHNASKINPADLQKFEDHREDFEIVRDFLFNDYGKRGDHPKHAWRTYFFDDKQGNIYTISDDNKETTILTPEDVKNAALLLLDNSVYRIEAIYVTNRGIRFLCWRETVLFQLNQETPKYVSDENDLESGFYRLYKIDKEWYYVKHSSG
ncbi:MAG: hypothetical protein LBO63_01100 [Oscillospiraceae bacterium]|jgi:hypothetical protein|nr:hypothetical protein [Oscillospiraceae bacterium]